MKSLGVPDPEEDLGYVMEAVRTIRRELDGQVPLISFPAALDPGNLYGGGQQQELFQGQRDDVRAS